MQEYLVLQGGILCAHLLGGILVLIQVLNERDVLGERWGSFLPFIYLALALDRRVVQCSNLAQL